LAEQWYLADSAGTRGTNATWKSLEAASVNDATAIPDGAPNGITVTATLQSSDGKPNVRIERMEFDIKLNAKSPSELKAIVISPSGTEVVIFDQPLSKDKDKFKDATVPDTEWPGVFTIGSAAFLGENAIIGNGDQLNGTWTLKLIDTKTGGMIDAMYESFTVRAWGSEVTDNSQYTFTREYTAIDKMLTDLSGNDTINMAAVHKDVTINLTQGVENLVGNDTQAAGKFVIANNTVIENAIGGGGNDTITGNAVSNLLKGSWGNDMLSGEVGNDTLIGGIGKDTLTGGAGNDVFVLTERDVTASTTSFIGDTITDFSKVDGNTDTLQLDVTALTRLVGSNGAVWKGNTAGLTGFAGTQGASALVLGNAATADFAQLLFSNSTLKVDIDGIGAAEAITLATLTGVQQLSLADFSFTGEIQKMAMV
jgi:Ca2+-binding RTX toxin-like protein